MSSHDNRGAPQRLLNYALAVDAMERGYPVFPVVSSGPNAKKPYTPRGFHDATIDADQARLWWVKHPTAFVAIPTSSSTVVVLDVDGPEGLVSLAHLCAKLGIEEDQDLTSVRVRTPSGGLHLHFRIRDGEIVRNRARDIGPGLDTRGVKEDGSPAGYIIIPGNRRPDGGSYAHIGESRDLADAAFIPKGLLYLMTFSKAQRAVITSTPALKTAVWDAYPSDWTAIFTEFQDRQRAEILARAPPADGDAVRRQAQHDLHAAAGEYAELRDGRHNDLFPLACRCAKYVSHRALSENEFLAQFMEAAAANGALSKYGAQWVRGTIRRALEKGSRDTLPPIARRFREERLA